MKERVLFINQGATSLATIASFFEKQGFQTETVTDRQEAWKKIAEVHYSFIFCGLISPAVFETNFLKELSDSVIRPCEIFVTGPDSASLAMKSVHQGARYYWANPVDIHEIELLFKNGIFTVPHHQPQQQRESTLLQIIKEIALTMELDGLVNILVDSVMELTPADGGAVLLLDERTGTLFQKAVRGLSGKEKEDEYFGLSAHRYYEILKAKKPVLLHHPGPPPPDSSDLQIATMIAAPIRWKEEPLAVLVVVRFNGQQSFSNDDFKLISRLSSEISGAVYNAVTHYKMKELTIKDDLTDAYNRRYFERFLDEEFARARRFESKLSLIFFDVDNLKEVNVRHGHLTGSKTLQEIAQRIILTVRGIDKVVRYGGDEFCVVLPETDTQGAFQVAERIRNTVANQPFQISDLIQVHLTGSIGIASFPSHASTKEELIRQADRAMLGIKNRTKNAIGVAQMVSS